MHLHYTSFTNSSYSISEGLRGCLGFQHLECLGMNAALGLLCLDWMGTLTGCSRGGGGGGGEEGESAQVSEPPLWSPLAGCSPLCSLELHAADFTAFLLSAHLPQLLTLLRATFASLVPVTNFCLNMLTPQSAH